jgi:hypothetical protein
MGNYRAILIGELDGHSIDREFSVAADAIAWVQGVGLSEFDDQPARGEVYSSNGELIWGKSNLQTKEQAEWDQF